MCLSDSDVLSISFRLNHNSLSLANKMIRLFLFLLYVRSSTCHCEPLIDLLEISKASFLASQLSLVKIVEIDQAFVDMILASQHPLSYVFYRLFLQLFDFVLVRARIGRSRVIRVSNGEMAKFCNKACLAACH